MNRIEIEVLTLMFRYPNRKNVLVDEVYTKLIQRYSCERDDFDRALGWLDANKFFDFTYDSSGNIESLVEITSTGYGVAMMMNLDMRWEAEDAARQRMQWHIQQWAKEEKG